MFHYMTFADLENLVIQSKRNMEITKKIEIERLKQDKLNALQEDQVIFGPLSTRFASLSNIYLYREKISGNIVLGDQVQSIPNYAFLRNDKIISCQLPQNGNLILIGDEAFSYTNILSLVIPESVNSFGTRCFWYCEQLQSVNIPSKVSVIPSRCFHGCKNLLNVSIHSNLKVIEQGAFQDCSQLRAFDFPPSLNLIMESAFENSGIQHVDLSKVKLTHLGTKAFKDCNNLQSVTIHKIEDSGDDVFRNCALLTNIIVPLNLKYAFTECTNVTNITLLLTGNYKKEVKIAIKKYMRYLSKFPQAHIKLLYHEDDTEFMFHIYSLLD